MKKIAYLLFGAALLFSACEDKELDTVLSLGNAPAFSAPAANTAIVLTEATANDLFPKFSWSAAEFGFDAGVSYSLELDKAGNGFKEPLVVGTTTALELNNIVNSKINGLLIGKSLPGGEVANVEFRIAAKINPDVPVVYSQPLTLKITPYEAVIVYPQLQVPGGYQGWDPTNNNTVIFSVKGDEKYEGYLYIKDDNAEYKFTKGPAWTLNWGDTGADGKLDPNGDNMKTQTAGVYKLNVNLNELTHSGVRIEWGLIGSATPNGWDSDQNMTYDPATNKWTVTVALKVGEIKFRANDDWGINLGDDGADKKAEYNGANIAVAADGNYTVELDLSQAVYRYKVTKN